VEQVFPELVMTTEAPTPPEDSASASRGEPPDYKVLNYTGLIPVLVKAVQEQQAQIAAQNARIEELTSLVNSLNKGK
jgi:hypothetical protein